MLLLVQSLVNREKEKYLLGCPEITRHLLPFILSLDLARKGKNEGAAQGKLCRPGSDTC